MKSATESRNLQLCFSTKKSYHNRGVRWLENNAQDCVSSINWSRKLVTFDWLQRALTVFWHTKLDSSVRALIRYNSVALCTLHHQHLGACEFDWIQQASTVFRYTRKWHHQIEQFLLENMLHRCVHKHKMLHNICYLILIGHKTSSLLQRHSCPEQVSLVLF